MKHQNEKLEHLLSPLRGDKISLPEDFSPPEAHEHSESFTTVRRAKHRGKEIEVRTTYQIKIDGEPFRVHTMVLDNGSVHCHGLPQYSFPSALDMARTIIDVFDVELPDDELGKDHMQHDKHHKKGE